MAFRIDLSLSVDTELRRILRDQFEYLLECLEQANGPNAADCVHEFRKSTKKLRALLRCASDALPRRDSRRWIEVLRAASAQLSRSRDLVVVERNLCRAYQALQPSADPSSRPWAELSLFEQISRHCADGAETVDKPSIREALKTTADEMRLLPQRRIEVDTLLKGAIKTYRKGRRLLRRIEGAPSVSLLHELRKRVKDQLYQLRLLSNLSPKTLRSEAVDFDQLAELLGELHDFGNLSAAIDASRQTYCQVVELEGLREWTDSQLHQLQADALQLAYRLYALPAKVRLHSWRDHLKQLPVVVR